MRLPWTIWRYTFLELFRLLLLTTAILVAVISFAATVRYIADGRLGPVETIRYMLLAMPPMLQYALPFAAGFAATLTYHRMGQDNELTAAAASGISHRALLLPALAAGLILTLTLTWMTGRIIPGFLREMERIITRDAAKFVAATIQSGRPLEVNDMRIHADTVRHIPSNPDHNAYETLLLTGVLALVLDESGQIQKEYAASQATVEFSRDQNDEAEGITRVAMVLRQQQLTTLSGGAVNTLSATQGAFFLTLPGLFDDDPKFLTTRQLLELPQNPDRLNVIGMRKHDLAVHLAERYTITALATALNSQGAARLIGPADETCILKAAGIRWNSGEGRHELIGRPGAARGIEVELYGPGSARSNRPLDPASATRLSATAGGLKSDIGKDRTVRRLSLTLELESFAATRETERGGERTSKSIQGLSPAIDPLAELLKKPSKDLLTESNQRIAAAGRDEFLEGPTNDLTKRLVKLGREVVGKHHERMAMSWACLVMVLTGALTAMRLGSSLPLTVYLWSFFPALLTVLTISAGQQMTRQMGLGGLVVLWAGVGLLVAYAAGAFWLVRRH